MSEMKLEPAGTSGQQQPARQSFPASAHRRRWFRLVALGLPIILLLVLELILHIVGYGYPTSFFLKVRQYGEEVLIENPKFGWRFFPPTIARAPLPLVLEPQKPAGTIRIFLLGESAAMGDPEPAYGFGRQLQRMLQTRHPLNHVEVVNVAMTAINSHVIREIAGDCVPRQGDLWLIYAGNNEVVGPFGAGTVFGPQAPSTAFVRATLAFKSSRLGQWLSSLRSGGQDARSWQGMELFLNNQVSAEDPRLKRVYENFGQNLSAIIRQGQRAGAKILLSTVAVNLKDCPPFSSAHRPGLSADALHNWQELFQKGRQAEAASDYTNALAAFQQAAQLDSDFAELMFQRATCELALGQAPAAIADFSRARDLDTLRFRTDSCLNAIIRDVASARQVPLVDLEKENAVESNGQPPGQEPFYDHVHLNFHGNYLVAKLLTTQVEKELFPSSSPAGPVLPEAEIAHQLAYTDFDRHRVGEEMRARLRQPPFSGQSNFEARDRQWGQLLSVSQTPPADCVWEYRAALALATADWVLRENFGRLLEAANDKPGAAEQWSQVVEQLPQEPEGYFHLANLAFDRGAYAQAATQFVQALQRRPNSPEALNGLGLALASEGRTNQALTQFRAALKLNQDYGAARVNMALILARSGDISGAISEYRAVIASDTNEVAARINLAKLLSVQGRKDEAITLYTQALALRPDNAIAQYDLANALAAQERHEEALEHYAAAVQYQPSFAEAQYNLAMELARAGRIGEATPHFAEVVRLSPSSADAHFNYGVALAKLRRYDEATQQFEATLKLQPNHPSARSMLERARQLSPSTRLGP